MSYIEVIKYLNSFVNYEKKPAQDYKEALTLERVVEFLKIIGNPQKSFKSVHVAGTKGKGSVCAFSAYILRECGLRSDYLPLPISRILGSGLEFYARMFLLALPAPMFLKG